jgi:hypothetical protein
LTVPALILAILLGTGSLGFGYAEAGFSSFARWIVIFGLAWLLAVWRGWRWFSSVGLFACVFVAAFGLWFDFSTGWMTAGAVFALFAWDMTEFRHRLRFLALDDDLRGMERRHIARVSLVILAGLILITIALLLQFRFTFEWGVLLVIVILIGMTQLVNWFKQQ